LKQGDMLGRDGVLHAFNVTSATGGRRCCTPTHLPTSSLPASRETNQKVMLLASCLTPLPACRSRLPCHAYRYPRFPCSPPCSQGAHAHSRAQPLSSLILSSSPHLLPFRPPGVACSPKPFLLPLACSYSPVHRFAAHLLTSSLVPLHFKPPDLRAPVMPAPSGLPRLSAFSLEAVSDLVHEPI
jgi:hypothetical protein